MPRLDHWPLRWTTKGGSIYYRTTPAERDRFSGKQWYRLGRTEEEAFAVWWSLKPEEAAPQNISAVIYRYRRARIPKLAPATQRQYQSALTLLDAVFGAMHPGSLKPVHVYDFREYRPPVQGNREVAVLSALMTYAVELGCVDRNLVKEVRRTEETPRDRYVTDAELEQFLTHCAPFLRAYVRLKSMLGIRQAQMLAIRLSDWDGERLRVTATKGGKDSFYQGDGLSQAVEACKALREGQGVRGLWLFSTRQGGRYTSDGFRAIWQRAMRKFILSGGQRFTEHDLRAKVASDDPANAQDRLQHRSSAMVRTVYDRKPAEVRILTARENRENSGGSDRS
jgi:integrase